MNTEAIVEALDNEIARLQKVKALLSSSNTNALAGEIKRSPGRPKKAATVVAPKKRKSMSPEARERIVEAQKARWAKVKRAAKKAEAVEAAV